MQTTRWCEAALPLLLCALGPAPALASDACCTRSVEFVGWNKIGSGLCSVFVSGDVGSVRAAVDAGAAAARAIGEVQSVHVIPRPHGELSAVLPK